MHHDNVMQQIVSLEFERLYEAVHLFAVHHCAVMCMHLRPHMGSTSGLRVLCVGVCLPALVPQCSSITRAAHTNSIDFSAF